METYRLLLFLPACGIFQIIFENAFAKSYAQSHEPNHGPLDIRRRTCCCVCDLIEYFANVFIELFLRRFVLRKEQVSQKLTIVNYLFRI